MECDFSRDPLALKNVGSLGSKSVAINFIKNRDVFSWESIIKGKTLKEGTNKWNEGTLWNCKECKYGSKRQYEVADHIEANHLPTFPGYKCIKCPREFASRLLFRVHIENVHCSFSLSEFQCEALYIFIYFKVCLEGSFEG